MSALDNVMSFLRGKGLTTAQAAGVAGNLQVESGFDPTASNPREGAIGIAQWEGGRRTALQAYARNTGGSETNLTTQLNFLWSELQGPEHGAYQRLVAADDPGTAAAVFDQYYERSSGSARQARIKNAQAIAGSAPSVPTTFLGGVGAGLGTVLGGVFGGGNSSGGAQVGEATGQAVDAALPDWSGLAVKVMATGVAGALVVVGLAHTVSQ